MASSRVRRGRRTQEKVAEAFRQHGWPMARSRPASQGGEDIENVPGLSVEVKARRDFNPLAAIRQARQKKGLPIVVVRPDGMGEKRVLEWLMILPLGEGLQLLRDAGYGGDAQS